MKIDNSDNYADLISRLRWMNNPTTDEAANVITVLVSFITALEKHATTAPVGLPARAPAKRPRRRVSNETEAAS